MIEYCDGLVATGLPCLRCAAGCGIDGHVLCDGAGAPPQPPSLWRHGTRPLSDRAALDCARGSSCGGGGGSAGGYENHGDRSHQRHLHGVVVSCTPNCDDDADLNSEDNQNTVHDDTNGNNNSMQCSCNDNDNNSINASDGSNNNDHNSNHDENANTNVSHQDLEYDDGVVVSDRDEICLVSDVADGDDEVDDDENNSDDDRRTARWTDLTVGGHSPRCTRSPPRTLGRSPLTPVTAKSTQPTMAKSRQQALDSKSPVSSVSPITPCSSEGTGWRRAPSRQVVMAKPVSVVPPRNRVRDHQPWDLRGMRANGTHASSSSSSSFSSAPGVRNSVGIRARERGRCR